LTIFVCCCFKDLLERATVTKTQISTQQQQQREALRQLAAEHTYDPTGKKLNNIYNITTYTHLGITILLPTLNVR